jgi:beta-lactam-binding protein with PASTA domain
MNTTPEPFPLFGEDSSEPTEDASATSPTLDTPAGGQDSGNVEPAEAPVASVPTHGVASADEMDAWLAGAAVPATQAWMASDDDADAAIAAWLAADPNAVPEPEGPVVVSGGKLDRIRPKRKPLVPVWLVWVLLGVLVLGGVLAGVSAYLAVRARVLVPTVAGLQTPAARERLATVGLMLTVTDRRFSTLPVDTILSQTPEAGAKAKRGSAVTVIVSAGTEEFTMPDVVGEGLSLARSQLEQKGLQVQVQTQASDQPSDTVLSSNPTAGSPMHTGDAVTLVVASGTAGSAAATSTPSATSTLVPYSLTGVRVTIDPAPPVAGQPDSALEVTRRLQSLLTASGAVVVTTRSIADTGTTSSTTARQLKAREGSPTVAVGFDVVSVGGGGMTLTYPSSTVVTATAAPSQALSSQISSALAGQGINAPQTAGGSDVVLSVTNAPYVRQTLGSTASPTDLANFRDPTWADKVARAVYQGIASIYGIKNAAP